MVGYSAQGGSAVFSAQDRNGSRLWLARPGPADARLLFETNRFLREIAEAPAESFEYQSLEGDTLVGWILLPPDVAEPRGGEVRYPLVTWVYPGTVSRDRPPSGAALNRSILLSPQLLAANGYAVLFPSMPLGSRSQQQDPLLHLTTGVLPAVDRAIELGYADPLRLALMGHSFGGYGTYGLITQTDRFHAAIALAGLSNLVSSYGVFDARLRYDERPHEELFLTWVSEAVQPGLGVPPWEDLERYMRNSPIAHVDRVETPLLIVHGDFDYVPIQAAEEFFTGLYRQGKRARFVRYWGEDHVLTSPANVRDMWRHIVTWLDEHLDGPDTR
jgi:dipeptidyl aminopeptidase/acylaminoacyl peptidase